MEENENQFVAGDVRFRKLIEYSYEGITLFDKYFNIVYRSPSAERITGWDTTERSKSTLNTLIYEGDKQHVADVLKKVLDEPGNPHTSVFQVRHFKGNYIWMECTFTNMLHDPDIDAIVGNFRDITDKKRHEELLSQTIKELSAYKYALDEAAIVAITDQKGVIRHVNDNFCRISKYKAEELIGQDHRIINSGYHDKAFIRDLWVTIAGGGIWKGEIRNKAKDGSFYWVDTTIVPFLNEQGKPYQYVAIRADITERKLNEEKIIEREHFNKTITDNLPAMIAYWTTDLRCLFANKGYLDWFGRQADEMMGIRKQELMSAEEYKLYEAPIREVLEGRPQIFERSFTRPNGRTIFTHTHYIPDLANGIVKGYYSLTYDISAIKLAEINKIKLEELLHKASNLARIGAWEIDLVKDCINWSEVTREIYEVDAGFNPSLRRAMSFFKEGRNREAIVDKVIGALKNGAPWDIESLIITARGNERWIRSIGEAEIKNGRVTRIYGSFQDIDARKKAEIAFEETFAEKNSILESIGDAFFAVDRNWIVTYWNSMAEKVFGKSKNELLNHNLWEVYSTSVGAESFKQYHRALNTGEAAHFEYYYANFKTWYEISAYPSANGLSVYAKDITQRKLSDFRVGELNDDLVQQAKALAMSNAELEQFAYVASHDLQEPLRMVTSFLMQLEKKYAPVIDDKGRQYIHFAVDGARRMRQIILDLLEYSRVGRTSDDMEPVDLNKLINEITSLYRKQMEETRASILFNNLPTLQTYKSAIRQVFQNLISNSIKYHKRGTAPIIRITAEEATTYWQFSVQDNGIGIEAEYFDKVFVIFQRLHNKDEYPGTGMGLAVTKKIVDNLGGRIWISSEPDKGSTFYFTILKI